MPALMIARMTVKDPQAFQEYLAKVRDVAAPYGAEPAFRGKADKVLTGGETDHELVLVVTFPSLDRIDAWYASPEYQALKPLRDRGADAQITSYEVTA